MSSARQLVNGNIRSYHKNVSQEYINTLDNVVALRWCSPDDRDRLAREMLKEDLITKNEAKEFSKIVGL